MPPVAPQPAITESPMGLDRWHQGTCSTSGVLVPRERITRTPGIRQLFNDEPRIPIGRTHEKKPPEGGFH